MDKLRKNNAFKDLFQEICRYYSTQGYIMQTLADKIDINLRTLQYWKAGEKMPDDYSLNLLIDFLDNNNGDIYAMRLKQILNEHYCIEKKEIKPAVFPKMSKKDEKIIRENFPNTEELEFLCGMITYNNKVLVIKNCFPYINNINEAAALIASYEYMLINTKKIFGIEGIEQWSYKIIRHLNKGRIPKENEDIEVIGQNALDSLIEEYYKNRRKVV